VLPPTLLAPDSVEAIFGGDGVAPKAMAIRFVCVWGVNSSL
jgi:hypothetical protein